MRSALTVGVLVIGLVSTADAATLFFEDFESWLSPVKWATLGSAVIDTDPLEGDQALKFGTITSGGDLFSVGINNPTGSYLLSFDYLGTCAGLGCGGFIGQTGGSPFWLFGSDPFTTESPTELIDDGEWHSYSIGFSRSTSLALALEDFNSSATLFPGDAWFDNVLLTDQFGSQAQPLQS